MALQKIKLQIVNILGTHDTYVSDEFSSSHVLSEGETFNKFVKEDVAFIIKENGFDSQIENIEWFDNANASIRFEENEFTVSYSMSSQYVTISID